MSIEVNELIKKAEEYYIDGVFEGTIENFRKVYDQDPELLSEENKEHFAKAIYEFNIRDTTFMTTEIEWSLRLISRLVSQKDTSNGEEDVYTDAIMTIMEYNRRQYKAKVEWYDKLDPKLLNPNIDKKNSYSLRDKWYSQSTKALLDDEQYKKCLELSKEALEEIEDIMNDDEAWFKIRMAKANMNLGNFDEAVENFIEGIKVKDGWSNKFALAECYNMKGDEDNAFKLALDAAVTDPKIRPLSKFHLYSLLMNLLLDKGYEKEAKKLADLKDEIIFVANQPVDKGDKESLDYIKSKLPDCYICNLDGKVIVGN
jgi:tetratricopeptide (TPR) repeat protein